MIFVECFVLLMTLVNVAENRGPHHPRGEAVLKNHFHYKPSKGSPEKLTEDVQLLHDIEHLQEHLEDVISEPDLSKMSDDELEFYYFQVHDTDKNNKLDGLEILQAILHISHDYDSVEEDLSGGIKQNQEEFEYYVEIIDKVLKEDDLDKDGYLSYPEYISGRKKTLIAEGKKEPSVKMIP